MVTSQNGCFCGGVYAEVHTQRPISVHRVDCRRAQFSQCVDPGSVGIGTGDSGGHHRHSHRCDRRGVARRHHHGDRSGIAGSTSAVGHRRTRTIQAEPAPGRHLHGQLRALRISDRQAAGRAVAGWVRGEAGPDVEPRDHPGDGDRHRRVADRGCDGIRLTA